MADIVSMPKLGFDMAEGTLIRWVVLEGEELTKGAVLAEIETDKATVEVESPHQGVVIKHLVSEGEIVPVNKPIAVVGEADEEVDLDELLGDQAEEADAEDEAQDQKAVKEPSDKETTKKTETPLEGEDVDGKLPGGVRASPLARRMAEDLDINLRQVNGSGPMGRIMKKDIQAYQETKEAAPTQVEAPAKEAPAEEKPPLTPLAPLPSAPTPDSERLPLNRLRAAIGRRMVEAKQQVPHFYVTGEYDVEALMKLRKQVNALVPEDQKISVNDFIVKASALTLRQFPNLNASLDGDEIVHHGQVNIGVAVAVEGGLLTVVNRDTDRKPLRQIAQEVREMVARARSGKVRPDDIEGSTFSVSNLGMFDVEHFVAIINPPEAAILAVGSARRVPVVSDDQITSGWRMKATISVDHRVSDGAEAAQFMKALKSYLEDPLRLLV
jgi:pyruvate dehydrogenase E2 component (dihydrolipoamide acetyltransferase)